MFPDSLTAKQLTCEAKKCAYKCCFGLAPYYKNLLFINVVDVDLFTLLFNETNKCTWKKQMDIHVGYWNVKSGQEDTKYFTSAFMGHSRSDDILSSFLKSVHKVDLSKLLHESMDEPNVNWKSYERLQDEMKKNLVGTLYVLVAVGYIL
ncbi:hypothetical protein AVEN_58359-1 [Araneus ventricosus]|uniref:Uncharacterized protein n=1 Tax=Araneus ventricosus TaxID=182803 RepID=A0A4Y2MJR7_ARAVE|nr:hypothetical protein AVEN_58359-1 [Araneus ventricosus]